MYRIGQGFDIHRLAAGRKFILGGIEIEYEKGLSGHSDADCLMHAVIDALFGALNSGDIGSHFPDNDPAYKDIDSAVLLKKAFSEVKSNGYIINNIDSTIFAQEPKLNPYISLMKEKLARILELNSELISIKAKTMEGQDSVGNKQAVSAQCIVLLKSLR